ncbi:hypothetical protein IQ217_14725 [Synechocystis salina LEGE 00031]|uniref:DUF7680 domain-containing protein n=1 Tax=Synechocystis salina LEGE 00031 TaxID=1828736 RepID=A0ABR9VUQ3_9SYNC|nr:hypothetical protein [Synechocystis salina LEGE 00041]MBE9255072.1 hypothetical protein [Synechocystis salina LEGE 00031]
MDRLLNTTQPRYQLRAKQLSSVDRLLEIWQMPCSATPHLKQPKRVAGLKGRNLSLIEPRLIRQLKVLEIDLAGIKSTQEKQFELDEVSALRLGLMFRVLAPMRNRDNMRLCGSGIEEMGKEEASYWLGMAMHRKNPRRVLMALRCLLTDPHR